MLHSVHTSAVGDGGPSRLVAVVGLGRTALLSHPYPEKRFADTT